MDTTNNNSILKNIQIMDNIVIKDNTKTETITNFILKNQNIKIKNLNPVLKPWLIETNQELIMEWYEELSYINVVLQFFAEKMKETESELGWWIIIITSLMSFLTLLDFHKLNFGNLFNDHYELYKTIFLSLLSITCTLIAAWKKKKNYIKRIKDADKRIYDIELLTGIIHYEYRKPLRSKIGFVEFTDKYFVQVNNFKTYTTLISPSEWKETIYKITKEHPNYIRYQYPWYTRENKPDVEWGKNVIKNYEATTYLGYCSKIFSCYFCSSKCCYKANKNNDGNPFS